MSVFIEQIPWACSYKHDGKSFAIIIMHEDGDQLEAQMPQVLPSFQIDGWAAGCVDNPSKLDEALDEAEMLEEPETFKRWKARKNGVVN